jgi:hypothetical protein
MLMKSSILVWGTPYGGSAKKGDGYYVSVQISCFSFADTPSSLLDKTFLVVPEPFILFFSPRRQELCLLLARQVVKDLR